ncbi:MULTISPECIES: SHOCT domain-containing protein [Pseudofrankia]|uniref:SHOCT domain-containing protein n=1 Tax=Pseudofrankia TaxID=2994363 RepID=UPI000234CDDC|nr:MULTISPECIES: SHOCT domain-containing protein [Pseudofrankia]OHV35381.1 hypothetical protein BCD49_05050 [Pseudofrankia sp. EUN1h]
MLWRHLKAQLIVQLCGGLVGPIFLLVYFSTGPENRHLLSWMLVAGLLITAIDVVVAMLLARADTSAVMLIGRAAFPGRAGFAGRAAFLGQAVTGTGTRAAELERDGVLALARITGMAETGISVNDQPLVGIRLRVEGPGFAFDAQEQAAAGVTRMATLNARKVVVLVDPATQAVAIDWDRSALVNGQVLARFTLAEDDTAYDLTGQAGPLLEILRILKAHDIPFDRMVDARSNPDLRDQLRAVVRQATAREGTAREGTAAWSPPTTDADGAPTLLTKPKRPAAERLRELDALRATGAISDTEYTTKRDQIIAEI